MALADGNSVASTNLKVIVKSESSGRHYTAYQIFTGDISSNTDPDTSSDVYANSNTRKLSNIQWATGVDSAAIIAALKGTGSGQMGLTINGTGTSGAVTAADVAEALSSINADQAIQVAKIFNTNKGSSVAKVSVAGSETTAPYTYTISDLTSGYYIVTDTTTLGTDDAASAILLNVVGDTSITEKVVKPSVDKKVQDETASSDPDPAADNDGYGDTADHDIGETFNFKLIATLPADSDYNAYATYLTKFVDTPSTGITFEEITSVTVAGKNSAGEATSVTVSAYAADTAPAGYKLTNNLSSNNNNGDGTKTLEIEIADLKTTAPAIDLTKGDTTITVIYTAHLNNSAYVTPVDGNTTENNNKVKLTYSNNPTTGGTGDTTEKTVYVFTYEIDNTKWAGAGTKVEKPGDVTIKDGETLANTTKTSWVDTANKKYYVKSGNDWYVMDPLPNAGFRLYSDSSCTTEIPLIYDSTLSAYRKTTTGETSEEMTSATETGIFNIKGLDIGTYYLKETTTPAGYNTVEPIKVTIGATHEIATAEKAAAATPALAVGDPIVKLNVTNNDNEIVDNSGTVLPSTGGVGTTIFYVVGSILVVAAGVLLITKKRMGRE